MKFIKKQTISKTLQNKLLRVAKIVERSMSELDWDSENFYLSEIIQSLGKRRIKSWGLEKRWHGGSSDYLYVSQKLRVVIKLPYTVGNSHCAPTMAIPTIIIPLPSPYDDSSEIWIQPLADVSRNAIRRFNEIWSEWIEDMENSDDEDDWYAINQRFGEDAHEGNYAMYRNKPVVIDW